MTDDVDLTPDKIAAAIERLEAEKLRRISGKPAIPEVPTAVERTFVADMPARFAPPAPPPAEPRQRRAKKRQEDRSKPQPFFIVMSNAVGNSPGEINEGYYVTKDRLLALCDGSGTPTGDWRPIEGPGALYTARRALRQRLAAGRGPGPDHSPIVYPRTGWR